MSENYQPTQEELDAFFQNPDRQKAYKETESPNNWAELPAGSYQGRIDSVMIEPDRNGVLTLKWTFIVLAPDQHRNRRIWLRQNLEEPSRLKFVKGALQGAGVEWWDDFASIDTRREELLDRIVELKLTQGGAKTDGSGFFMNTYVNRFLGMYNPGVAAASESPAQTPVKNDEIPF